MKNFMIMKEKLVQNEIAQLDDMMISFKYKLFNEILNFKQNTVCFI